VALKLPTWISRTGLTAGVLLVAFARPDLAAQTRRALLIGINHYTAPPGSDTAGWVGPSGRALVPNLDGAVNDVASMQDLLRARFGFDPAHMRSLTDSAATRDAIVAAIEQLIADAQSGDVVVFFYAGHGSQRRNSLSARGTKLDQTIVPVEANSGGTTSATRSWPGSSAGCRAKGSRSPSSSTAVTAAPSPAAFP
jgi:caspase domain-containing protein